MDNNSIVAVLHLREAAECLKSSYPKLSSHIIEMAVKIMKHDDINEEEFQHINDISKFVFGEE